jgi:hypothetical protein
MSAIVVSRKAAIPRSTLSRFSRAARIAHDTRQRVELGSGWRNDEASGQEQFPLASKQMVALTMAARADQTFQPILRRADGMSSVDVWAQPAVTDMCQEQVHANPVDFVSLGMERR